MSVPVHSTLLKIPMMPAPDDSDETERLRIRLAFWLAIVGLFLAAALAVFLVLSGKMASSAEVVALVGLFTSVTGTLVGAFFGLQIGSAGIAHERKRRQEAERIIHT